MSQIQPQSNLLKFKQEIGYQEASPLLALILRLRQLRQGNFLKIINYAGRGCKFNFLVDASLVNLLLDSTWAAGKTMFFGQMRSQTPRSILLVTATVLGGGLALETTSTNSRLFLEEVKISREKTAQDSLQEAHLKETHQGEIFATMKATERLIEPEIAFLLPFY